MRVREASASEPLMRCRKQEDGVKTGGLSNFQDESRGEPAYCLGGARYRSGANLIQAFAQNVGTCVPMVREKLKWKTHESESTDAGHRGGTTRSSDEVP